MANGNLEFNGEEILFEGQALGFLSSGNEEEPSSQNTFGLPAGSVALIESRFGSVANFLRLRNQGQV
jgi:hypothetical protein